MMQMTEPMAIAPTMPSEPVEPLAFSAMVEMSSVAMAMPETGLFDDPIRPTMREETVAKKKPNTSTISAPRKLTGMAGNSHMNTAISRHTAKHDLHGDVLLGAQSTGGTLTVGLEGRGERAHDHRQRL